MHQKCTKSQTSMNHSTLVRQYTEFRLMDEIQSRASIALFVFPPRAGSAPCLTYGTNRESKLHKKLRIRVHARQINHICVGTTMHTHDRRLQRQLKPSEQREYRHLATYTRQPKDSHTHRLGNHRDHCSGIECDMAEPCVYT